MATFHARPEDLEHAAEVLKTLAHPVRLCLVLGLSRCGGCAVHEIQGCLDRPQAVISQHLAKLRAAGLVTACRVGKEVRYEVTSPLARELAALVERFSSP